MDEGAPDGRAVVMLHGNPTWGLLYRDFIRALVEAGHRAIVPAAAAVPNSGRRGDRRQGPPPPILVFPREIPSGPDGPVSDLCGEVEAGLERHFRSKPVTIAWAMRDIAFTPEILQQAWLGTFPDARVIRLEDAGHHLQEDAHERIVPALLEFLAHPPA